MAKRVLVTKHLKDSALNDLKKVMKVIMPDEDDSFSNKKLKMTSK